MKIPYDELPLKVHGIGNKQNYGQYNISKQPTNKDKDNYHAGRITGKALSQYIVNAANNLPKAITILNTIKLDAEMALNGDWDKSDDGFQCQIDIIDKFLKLLEIGNYEEA